MIGILYAQLKILIRKPSTFLLMTLFMLVFALILGGDHGPSSAYIPVYSELPEEDTEQLLTYLNEVGTQRYEVIDEAELIKFVREGDSDAGIIFYEDHFEYVIATETPTFAMVEQNVEKSYQAFLQEKAILTADQEKGEAIVNELDSSLFSIDTQSTDGGDSWIYDSQLQSIFGFSVFFVIYTIAYNVINILIAKQSGVWDRFILSPAKKWEMYVGILLYAFIIGYIQVLLVFSVFHFILGNDFHGGFGKTLIILIPYVLSIVSLAVLLAGISKNIQTFNALVPLVSVSFAMIGGAYWPIEIVTNKIMLILSEFVPIHHVMDAFKEVTIYGGDISAALFPVSILLLMSVIFMGLGLNLIERREQ